MKRKYTHVLWDFNGTVLDDVRIGIESINQMLEARGLPVLPDVAAYQAIFDFPVETYYQRLGFDFAREDFRTVLAPCWVALYRAREPDAPLCDGVRQVTAAFRAAGLSQSVLSATERGMLMEQLNRRGAAAWFDEIWGTDSIHGDGKETLADAWRAAHPDASAVLLGDTTHDYAAAERIGADCILVASGHHGADKLSRCGVPVVRRLVDCLPLVLDGD